MEDNKQKIKKIIKHKTTVKTLEFYMWTGSKIDWSFMALSAQIGYIVQSISMLQLKSEINA